MVKNKESGGVGGVKITPSLGYCYFAKLCWPTTRVPDWCFKLQLSITSQMCHLDIVLLQENVKDGKLCKW